MSSAGPTVSNFLAAVLVSLVALAVIPGVFESVGQQSARGSVQTDAFTLYEKIRIACEQETTKAGTMSLPDGQKLEAGNRNRLKVIHGNGEETRIPDPDDGKAPVSCDLKLEDSFTKELEKYDAPVSYTVIYEEDGSRKVVVR